MFATEVGIMQKIVLGAACLLLGAGCELVPAEYPEPESAAPADRGDTFSLWTDAGRAVVARVSACEVSSADVRLSRYRTSSGSAIRGTAFGQPVNVDTSAEEVTGLIGTTPLDLTVTREDGGLRLTGLVRGAPSDFRLDARGAQGTLGACSYELSRADLTYEGRRSCGGSPEGVTLRLPRSLGTWSDEARAALLAVLLSGR
jgi:hypothetical protein